MRSCLKLQVGENGGATTYNEVPCDSHCNAYITKIVSFREAAPASYNDDVIQLLQSLIFMAFRGGSSVRGYFFS
jgi:hypothetical protein